MQINRLFEIIYILLDKEKVSAKELSQHFEVSTRTIYRDVETLSSAGIPIYMTKGNGGGISLLPDFVINKAVLTDEEKNNILTALQSLRLTEVDSAESIISKLHSLFGENNISFIEIDYNVWGNFIKVHFDTAYRSVFSS